MIGKAGGGIGYDEIPNSLAIEFDFYNNDIRMPYYDQNGNHIGVQCNGTAPNTVYHNTKSNLGYNNNIITIRPDSTKYYAKIEYSEIEKKLKVYVSDNLDFKNPDIVVNDFDISKRLNLIDGEKAYYGFTSATWGSYERHAISYWYLCPKIKLECETEFDYPEFKSTEDFNLVNNAKQVNNYIRFTEPIPQQKGAIWYNKKVPVKNGFITTFSFRMSEGFNDFEDGSLPGADGFAFVIQNSSSDAIGYAGGGIGYANIPNSIAIEIDTYCNNLPGDRINDPNGNHIALQTMGKFKNLARHDTTATLGMNDKIFTFRSDGTIYYCRIDYDGNEMKVYLDTNSERNNLVLNLNSFDISNTIELDGGCMAYVGLTSATGTSAQKHELLSWSLCPNPCQGIDDVDNSQFTIKNSQLKIQIMPNPFNYNTKFEYYVDKIDNVKLDIFDVYGAKIAVLIDEFQSIGIHEFEWNPRNIAVGMYYYTMEIGDRKYYGKVYYVKE